MHGHRALYPMPSDMLEIAKLADEAGFDSVWNGAFFNHPGSCGDMYKAYQDCHRYCLRLYAQSGAECGRGNGS